MQSEDGREELRAGSFDLDRTTERVMEVGAGRGGGWVLGGWVLKKVGWLRRVAADWLPAAWRSQPPACCLWHSAGAAAAAGAAVGIAWPDPPDPPAPPPPLPPAPQEGKKDASPEAAQRADDQDVKDSVKSRVVAGSQTS